MYAGNSRLVRAEGDEDLTGTLFIGKRDLLDVGGYDERIQDFGGEQEDLLERLQKNGMRRMDVDYNTLLHNHHEDEGERGLTSLQVEHLVEVAVNRELRHMVPPWNSLEAWRSFSFNGDSLSEMNASIPSQMHANVQYRSILARRRVQSIRDMLSADDVESVKSRVLSKMLYERFDLPGDFSDLLEWSDKDRILFGLLDKMQKANSNVTPRVLVIQCVGGMVSRLYALASGLAAAYHTDRLPIIVWEKEPPLVTAFFHELFEVQDHFMVVDVDLQYFFDEYGEIEHDQAVERMMDVYDLVGLNEGDSHPIRTTNGRHIFIRAFAAIEAEIVRFTSPMSMREQIQLFEFDESVQSRLRHLVDQRLSERLGIYLPALPSNQSDITEGIVSRVKEKIQHTGFGALPSAYIIGDLDTLESLRPMLGSVIGESPLLMTCTAEETDCSRAEVSQLLALSKTKEFIATHEDKLWELVMLIRGQSTDW